MDALHDPLVGCAGAMAPEQFDLNMIERVDIGGAKFGKGVALRVTGIDSCTLYTNWGGRRGAKKPAVLGDGILGTFVACRRVISQSYFAELFWSQSCLPQSIQSTKYCRLQSS